MNIPHGHRYTTQLGGRELTIETGKYAKQVSGSVTVRMGDTLVLVTAHMSDDKSPMSFLPLTVEYEERHYAVGKIPGSFLRREGRPANQATLNARIIDRQIRPLFPKGLRHEIQVIATVLSADQQVDAAPLAAIGASAALSLSDIPWNGPVACTHVGHMNGAPVIAPTFQQLMDPENRLELTVAASKDAVLMVEAAADELPEDAMVEAITAAQAALAPVVALIEKMRAEHGQPKRDFESVIDVLDADVADLTAAARAADLTRHAAHPRQARALGGHQGAARPADRRAGARRRRRRRQGAHPAAQGGLRQGRGRRDAPHGRRGRRPLRRPRRPHRPPDLDRDRRAADGARLGRVHARRDPGPGRRHARHRPRQPARRRPRDREVRGVHAPLQLPALLHR